MCTQSRPALCCPMDCSPPGSSDHGTLQARILSRLQFSPPGDLPNPGIEPASLVSPVLAEGFFTTVAPGSPQFSYILLFVTASLHLKKQSYLLQNSHEPHLLLYFFLSLFLQLLATACGNTQCPKLTWHYFRSFFSSFSQELQDHYSSTHIPLVVQVHCFILSL